MERPGPGPTKIPRTRASTTQIINKLAGNDIREEVGTLTRAKRPTEEFSPDHAHVDRSTNSYTLPRIQASRFKPEAHKKPAAIECNELTTHFA